MSGCKILLGCVSSLAIEQGLGVGRISFDSSGFGRALSISRRDSEKPVNLAGRSATLEPKTQNPGTEASPMEYCKVAWDSHGSHLRLSEDIGFAVRLLSPWLKRCRCAQLCGGKHVLLRVLLSMHFSNPPIWVCTGIRYARQGLSRSEFQSSGRGDTRTA